MKLTNELNLPAPFVDAVKREYKYVPKRYSVTSLLKGTRETILQRRHFEETTVDVASQVWMIFGSAVHSVLENAQEAPSELKENKLTVELDNGYTLSGIFDLYNDDTGVVTDYKTASMWKVKFDDWNDYMMQLLAYCWMLREIGFDAHRGELVVMLKDHSTGEAMRKSDYPPYPVITKGWDFTQADFDYFKEWLMRKFEDIEQAEQLPDEDLPLCTSEERWAKPAKWAVYKLYSNGSRAKKASKLLDTKELAEAWATAHPGNKYEIEYRPGEDTKCLCYCSAAPFCDYYQQITEVNDGM